MGGHQDMLALKYFPNSFIDYLNSRKRKAAVCIAFETT
jgi:hypothetical protein